MTASEFAEWAGFGGEEEEVAMGGGKKLAVTPHFNLWVSLADCTGDIEGVWLGGKAALEILRHSVSQPLASHAYSLLIHSSTVIVRSPQNFSTSARKKS